MSAVSAQAAQSAPPTRISSTRSSPKHRGRPGELLSILEEIQEHHPHKYLPDGGAGLRGRANRSPAAQIYSVATFYALFNLKPQGDHTVCICRGTACHTRGSRNLLERLKLNSASRRARRRAAPTSSRSPPPTASTPLRTVACFGQCALAPVVEVDHAHPRARERAGARSARSRPLQKRRTLMPRISRPRAVSTPPARPGWRSCCPPGRASPSAWARAAPATAPKASTTPSPTASNQRGLERAARARRLLRILRRGAAGQRLAARQAAGDPAPRAGQRRPAILDDLAAGRVPTELALCKIEEWDHITGHVKYGVGYPEIPHWNEVPVLQGAEEDRAAQLRPHQPRATSRSTSPSGGYQALYKVLIDATPTAVIEQIKAAKLRGRGGAGYPDRPQVGVPAQGRGRRPSTSSATPTKAIPAPT